MERLNLEQINNMTESQMREYLRGLEIENQRADAAKAAEAQAEQERKEAEAKAFDEYFEKRFEGNIHPRFRGQY